MDYPGTVTELPVTMPGPVTSAASQLVLVLFPGIDLLGRGFEQEGFSIVRGPDLLWGGDIRKFRVPAGKFEGIIGGSPCQDFSKARRAPPTGLGLEMLGEFLHVVTEAQPEWFLLENVPGVPDVELTGFTVQRFNVNANEFGLRQNRLRKMQFGFQTGNPLVIHRAPPSLNASQPACLATEGNRGQSRRSWADFCELQGLPRDFDLPGMSRAAKYRAVGNGVPVPLAAAIARAIQNRQRVTAFRMCACDCGRAVHGKQELATAACRKRMERRRRDAAGVGVTGPVTETPALSLW